MITEITINYNNNGKWKGDNCIFGLEFIVYAARRICFRTGWPRLVRHGIKATTHALTYTHNTCTQSSENE